MADKVHQGGAAWEEASRRAKSVKLKDYLDTLTEAQKQHALEDVAQELKDLKINPADLGKAEAVPEGDGKGAAFAAAFANAINNGGNDAGEGLMNMIFGNGANNNPYRAGDNNNNGGRNQPPRGRGPGGPKPFGNWG